MYKRIGLILIVTLLVVGSTNFTVYATAYYPTIDLYKEDDFEDTKLLRYYIENFENGYNYSLTVRTPSDAHDFELHVNTGTVKVDRPGKYIVEIRFRVHDSGDYSYKISHVTITDADLNTKPTINLTNPATTQTINSTGVINISGTVSDVNNDNIKVSATIGGINKFQTFTGPITNQPFTLTWTGLELPGGTYNTIPVTVTDGITTVTANHTGQKIVDKTKPKLNILITTQ